MVQDWRGVGQKELPLVLSFIHSLTRSSISRVKTALRWDFPGDPVVKTSPCNAKEFNPWLGNENPTCLLVRKPKYKTKAVS